MVHRCLLAVLLLISSSGYAQQHAPIDFAHLDDRHKDIYTIYSQLMPGAVFAALGPDKNQQWAIADSTVSIDDMSPALAPDAALKAPSGNAQAFREALGSFRALQHDRMPIVPVFRLDRPYVLLSESQAAAFRNARTRPDADNATTQRYAVYPGITYFSDVYFDTKRSVALVYQLDWCANLCAQGEWIYLEKQNGQWIRRSGQAAIVPGARSF